MSHLFDRLLLPDTLSWGYFPGIFYNIMNGLKVVKDNFIYNAEFEYAFKMMCITAGVGTGKTTALPVALHLVFGESVAIAVPKVSIALQTQKFLSTIVQECFPNIKVSAISGAGSRRNQNSQIIIITYGVLRLWLQNDNSINLPKIIVFDESHNLGNSDEIIITELIRTNMIMDINFQQRIDQRFWIWQSATPDWTSLLKYFYGSNMNNKILQRHIVNITVSTPLVNVEYNTKPASNLPRNIYETLSAIAVNGPVLVFLPTFFEQNQLCVKYKKITDAMSIEQAEAIILSRKCFDENPRLIEELENKSHYLIASTKYGEEGITYPNLNSVIDSTISITSFYLPEIGIFGKKRTFSSQTTIHQRCGRVGRTRAGSAFALVTREELMETPQFEPPDIILSLGDEEFRDITTSKSQIESYNRFIYSPSFLSWRAQIDLFYNLGLSDYNGKPTTALLELKDWEFLHLSPLLLAQAIFLYNHGISLNILFATVLFLNDSINDRNSFFKVKITDELISKVIFGTEEEMRIVFDLESEIVDAIVTIFLIHNVHWNELFSLLHSLKFDVKNFNLIAIILNSIQEIHQELFSLEISIVSWATSATDIILLHKYLNILWGPKNVLNKNYYSLKYKEILLESGRSRHKIQSNFYPVGSFKTNALEEIIFS